MNRDDVKAGEYWWEKGWDADGEAWVVRERGQHSACNDELMAHCYCETDAIRICEDHNLALRLPLTADGVRVVPGMTVYSRWSDEWVVQEVYAQGRYGFLMRLCLDSGAEATAMGPELYSSREALRELLGSGGCQDNCHRSKCDTCRASKAMDQARQALAAYRTQPGGPGRGA